MQLVLTAFVGTQVVRGQEAVVSAQAEFPEGRIYTGLFGPLPNGGMGREMVAIDVKTGTCQTIGPDGTGLRVSPDGKSIAYSTFSKNPPVVNNVIQQACDVWIKRLDVEEEPNMIWSGAGSAKVSWLRDGEHVIVTQGELDNQRSWKHTQWKIDVATSEAEPLKLPTTESVINAAHHSDRVIVWSLRDKGIRLLTMLPDGTEEIVLTKKGQRDYYGHYSADDNKIVFARREGGTKLKICTANVDGSDVQVAYNEQGVTTPQHVCWSLDGKRLAVVLFDWSLDEHGRRVRRRDDDSKFRIAVMDLDGKNFRELTLDRDVREIGELDWR
jgi:Tol biopolymer transport system component